MKKNIELRKLVLAQNKINTEKYITGYKRYDNFINKSNLKCIYLIQTSRNMPELLKHLKNKKHILLSYK